MLNSSGKCGKVGQRTALFPVAAPALAERYARPESLSILMRESLDDVSTDCAPPTTATLAAAAFPIKVPPHEEGGGGGEGWRHSDIGSPSTALGSG